MWLEGCVRAAPWFVRPWGAAVPNFPRGGSPQFQSDLQESDSLSRSIIRSTRCCSMSAPNLSRFIHRPTPRLAEYWNRTGPPTSVSPTSARPFSTGAWIGKCPPRNWPGSNDGTGRLRRVPDGTTWPGGGPAGPPRSSHPPAGPGPPPSPHSRPG